MEIGQAVIIEQCKRHGKPTLRNDRTAKERNLVTETSGLPPSWEAPPASAVVRWPSPANVGETLRSPLASPANPPRACARIPWPTRGPAPPVAWTTADAPHFGKRRR